MKSHFQMFAAYNHWANLRLYEATAALSDAELRDNKGAFFGSLHGTLNHLLATDRVWMKRFTGAGEAPSRLDAILCEDFDSLRLARTAEDARIIGWIDSLSDADLANTFTYTPITIPEPVTQRLALALAHFFNHQTHHRGQCHMTLTALGKPSLNLDLVSYLRTPEGLVYA